MYDATATTSPRAERAEHRRRLGPGPSADLETFTTRARAAEAARCSPWRRGNAVDLLIDGDQIFDAMFATIAAARRSIFLETYILEADGPGERLAELLAHKSEQGVDVRLIFDSLGSFSTERAYFDVLAARGVRVCEFNPVRPWHRRFRWIFNQRTHRKLLVVDREVAFIGGVNFSSVHSGGSVRGRRKLHRRSVRGVTHTPGFAGPSSRICRRCFSNTGSNREAPPLHRHPALYESRVRPGWRSRPVLREVAATRCIARVLATLRTATQRVLITTAYFVPTRRLVRELRRTAERGVQVALMIPSGSDSWSAAHAGRSRYGELLASGVEIYEHCTSMLHAKTIVIDDDWCSVGSSNMDWRSLLHNAEANVIALDHRLAEELAQHFERDAASCERITVDAWSTRPWSSRLCERLVRPFHLML